MEMEKSHKLYQIVRLRQMVMKWRVQAIQRARLMKARSRKLITYNHPSLSSSLSSPHASPLSSSSSSSRKNKGRKEGEGEGEGKEVEVEEEEDEEGDKIEGLPPKGFVAVYVGDSECRHEELRRFLVQIECLCHPAFQKLLHKAEDEFGFAHHHGGIVIPCNATLFQRMLALLQQQQQQPNKSTKRHGHSHHQATNTTSTSTTSSNIDDDASTSVELEKLVELCLGDQPKPQPQPQTCGGNGPSQPIASLHDLIH